MLTQDLEDLYLKRLRFPPPPHVLRALYFKKCQTNLMTLLEHFEQAEPKMKLSLLREMVNLGNPMLFEMLPKVFPLLKMLDKEPYPLRIYARDWLTERESQVQRSLRAIDNNENKP